MELGLVCFRNTGKEGLLLPLFVLSLLSTQALLLERNDEFGTLET